MRWTRLPRSMTCWGRRIKASSRSSSSMHFSFCDQQFIMHIKRQNSIFCPSGRSRAMQFNFPPKKGTGISRLIPKCPAPALSLLYQMLAYDPDERITADTALRHTYFRETRCTIKHEATRCLLNSCCVSIDLSSFRMAEKRAESFHRLSGTLHGPESRGSDKPLNHTCRPARIRKLKGRHVRQTPLLNVSPSPHSRAGPLEQG